MSQEKIRRAYIKTMKVRVRREDDKKTDKITAIKNCHRILS